MTSTTSKAKRDALLDELESIRNLLEHDSELSEEEDALLAAFDDIPMLLPEDDDDEDDSENGYSEDAYDIQIPTLLADDDDEDTADTIPLLSNDPDDLFANIPTLSITTLSAAGDISAAEDIVAPVSPPILSEPAPAPHPLDAIRAAAAKVAANATRNRPPAHSDVTAAASTATPVASSNPFLPDHIRQRLHGTELSQHIRDLAVPAEKKAEIAAEKEIETELDIEDFFSQAEELAPQDNVPTIPEVLIAHELPTPAAPASHNLSAIDKQLLIDDIVQATLPKLESLLRELLAEKL